MKQRDQRTLNVPQGKQVCARPTDGLVLTLRCCLFDGPWSYHIHVSHARVFLLCFVWLCFALLPSSCHLLPTPVNSTLGQNSSTRLRKGPRSINLEAAILPDASFDSPLRPLVADPDPSLAQVHQVQSTHSWNGCPRRSSSGQR